MLKAKAFELLGPSAAAVAAAVGVTPSAVSQWPPRLTPRIADRVLAALARKHLPADMVGALAAQDPAPQAECSAPDRAD